MGEHVDADTPLFDPPLYLQRMSAVMQILKENGCTRIIDYGCGEGKLLGRLRVDESFRQLLGVDIDRAAALGAQSNIEPLLSEYLNPRLKPLSIQVFAGSVGEADARFAGADGVACVEVYVAWREAILG